MQKTVRNINIKPNRHLDKQTVTLRVVCVLLLRVCVYVCGPWGVALRITLLRFFRGFRKKIQLIKINTCK